MFDTVGMIWFYTVSTETTELLFNTNILENYNLY